MFHFQDIQDFRVTSFIVGMIKVNSRQIYSELSFEKPTEQEGAFMHTCEGLAWAAGFEAGGGGSTDTADRSGSGVTVDKFFGESKIHC